MAASASYLHPELARFGRPWWLPPNGHGNGLDDSAWAPLADVRAAMVDPLLAEFRAAGVPAYAAPAPTGLRSPATALPTADRRETYRIWVGSSAHSRAEETLRTALPALLRRFS